MRISTFLKGAAAVGRSRLLAASLAAAACCPAVADQFYRLSVFGNSGTDSKCLIQLSRMCFYDSAGNAVSDGLILAADGAAASELQYGEVSQALAYNAADNSPAILFEDSNSKWCFNNENGGARAAEGAFVITMRLAENAAPAVSYNFRTGNDDAKYPTRSLGAWPALAGESASLVTVRKPVRTYTNVSIRLLGGQ